MNIESDPNYRLHIDHYDICHKSDARIKVEIFRLKVVISSSEVEKQNFLNVKKKFLD